MENYDFVLKGANIKIPKKITMSLHQTKNAHWKRTVEKSETNATNVIIHVQIQAR